MNVTFRYFEQPHAFSTYRTEPHVCDICGRGRPGYDARAFSGSDEMEFVCDECLASGKLAARDAFTNQGDIGALRKQLAQVHPGLSDDEREALARERTAELEQRTPHLVTWQDWFWPAHCGDYCCYIKEVGQPELARLAQYGDGVAFFAAHCPDIQGADHAREVWDGIRPDAPESGAVAYSVGVYLFRCLTCGEYVVMWDCD